MKNLLLGWFIFTACTHKQIDEKVSRTDFFLNKIDAFQTVQKALQQQDSIEQLININNITYIDAAQKKYAIVFYQSNLGNNNIVFEQQHNSYSAASAIRIKCTGDYCDCKVKTLITREGDVKVECNCQNCTMQTNQN